MVSVFFAKRNREFPAQKSIVLSFIYLGKLDLLVPIATVAYFGALALSVDMKWPIIMSVIFGACENQKRKGHKAIVVMD